MPRTGTYTFFLVHVLYCILSWSSSGERGEGGGGQGAVALAKPQIHPGAVNRGKAVM